MSLGDYTPQQIEEILQAFFDVAGTRQYIGARYVPIFGRGRGTSVDWDEGANAYEPLSIVYWNGDTYTSRRYVPAGIDIQNTDYWVITGRYNAQVEQYRQEVMGFSDRIADIESTMEEDYVPFPDSALYPKYGTTGQVLTTLSDGTTKWENPVVPSDAQAETVITTWLNNHPEATTTVQDGAVTTAKLADGAVTDAKLAQTGGVLTLATNNRGALDTNIELMRGLPVVTCIPNEKVVRSSGSFSADTTMARTPKIPVAGLERLYFSGITENLTDGAFYDASGTYISGTSLSAAYGYLNIPSNAAYLATSGLKSQMSKLKIENPRLSGIDADIDTLEKHVRGLPYDELEFAYGAVNSTGEVVSRTNSILTEKFTPTRDVMITFDYDQSDTIMAAIYYYNADGTYTGKNTSWLYAPSAFIVTTDMKVIITVRYTNSADIAQISDITDHISCNYGMNGEYHPIYEQPTNPEKHCHFSIDDVTLWSMFTTNTKYSIWENAILNRLLYFHLKYGMTITLNCFNETTDYDIADVVSDYQAEFKANSSWLKFAFHSKDSETGYSTDDATLATEYQKFVTAIHTLTGTYDSIDHVTRLAFFAGSLNNVLALQGQQAGIVGLLTADDTRNSYYLTSDESAFLQKNLTYFDDAHQMTFIHNVVRFESAGSLTNFDTLATSNFMRFIECWTHQSHLSDVWENIEDAYKWFTANGYGCGFAETHLVR